MAQLIRLVAPLLALLLAGSAGLAADAPKALVGRVLSIVDGDTIKVRFGDRTETVRYIGMNAPELHHPTKGVEPFAREATKTNRKLVDGQTVRLELDVQERDKYGRLLAYVFAGDLMVNAELVSHGYAQVMTIPPNVRHQELFLKLQREARLLQLGLWRGTKPLPPEPGASESHNDNGLRAVSFGEYLIVVSAILIFDYHERIEKGLGPDEADRDR